MQVYNLIPGFFLTTQRRQIHSTLPINHCTRLGQPSLFVRQPFLLLRVVVCWFGNFSLVSMGFGLFVVALTAFTCSGLAQWQAHEPQEKKWWQETVIYEIYPQSFYDSDGDGLGDLKGNELVLTIHIFFNEIARENIKFSVRRASQNLR